MQMSQLNARLEKTFLPALTFCCSRLTIYPQMILLKGLFQMARVSKMSLPPLLHSVLPFIPPYNAILNKL